MKMGNDTVGVRQLKQQTIRILRLVQEQGVEVEITHRGKVIARLVPATAAQPAAGMAEVRQPWQPISICAVPTPST